MRVILGRHVEMGSLELQNTYILNSVDYFQTALQDGWSIYTPTSSAGGFQLLYFLFII